MDRVMTFVAKPVDNVLGRGSHQPTYLFTAGSILVLE
jgi:hypothetical protein